MQQIRHAAESGALQDGDQLPSIRTLAEDLLISPNTVAKAYAELSHEGLVELRQGSGAFLRIGRRTQSRTDQMHASVKKLADLIVEFQEKGLTQEEIRRLFESALFLKPETARGR
jgi:GntR family transcriptional regulator